MSKLMHLKKRLRGTLSDGQVKKIRAYQSHHFRGLQHAAFSLLFGSNLKALAILYGTDKWGSHWYAPHYHANFHPLRRKKISILEIGIGGYDDPMDGGSSLRMWRTYFPKARVYGIDIHDKKSHDERRIKTFKGSQVDGDFLDRVIGEIGSPDIIIDDGSHINSHIIGSFEHLFPKMKEGGIYAVEDLQTSYWPEHYGGLVDDMNNPNTAMGFFKQLVDGLNHEEFKIEGYEPSYYDKNIAAISFYHNLAFIQKR